MALPALFAAWDLKPEQVQQPKSENQIIRERDANANRTINADYGAAVAGEAAVRRARETTPAPAPDSPEGIFAQLAKAAK